MTTTLDARPAPASNSVPVSEDIGAYGGGSTNPYSSKLADNLFALAAPTGKLTARRIEAMGTHYQLAASLLILAMPMLSAVGTVHSDDEDQAAWLQAAWDRIAPDIMRAATKAPRWGYSPSVLVWDHDDELDGLVITKVRDLEPKTCTVLTDAAGGFAGIRQKTTGDDVIIDNAFQCLWITEGMENGNLYGRSLLRAALDPWKRYLATDVWHSRYLERFGEPVVRVRHPPGEVIRNQGAITAAVTANLALGEDATPATPGWTPVPAPIVVTHQRTALEMGEGLASHSVLTMRSDQAVGPDGKPIGYAWDVDFLESAKSGAADFQSRLDAADRAMARAVLIPDTLIANPDTGTYALGKAHRSIFDAAIEGRLVDVARQVSAWVIDRLRLLNFPTGPKAHIEFAGISDADSDKLWELLTILVENGRLPIDVIAAAEEVGIPLLPEDERPADPPPVDAPPASDQARAHAGHLHTHRRALLAADGVGDTSTLPGYAQPQAGHDGAWARALTPLEQRVAFAKAEADLNDAEATAIETLASVLDQSREAVLRQVAGIMGKPTAAEQIAAIGTLDLKLGSKVADAWETLIRAVWQQGLDGVRAELTKVSEEIGAKVPAGLGPDARAVAKVQAQSAGDAQGAKLLGNVRATMLNAVRSGVARAGVESLVSGLYATETSSEAATPRLGTRTLSSQSLNGGRADAVVRGGVRLAGAQYSAILDRSTCELCERQDEQVIAIEDLDLTKFTPPLHHNCRCLWVWITADEEDFTPTWTSPPASLVDANGGLVLG